MQRIVMTGLSLAFLKEIIGRYYWSSKRGLVIVKVPFSGLQPAEEWV